MKPGQHRRSRFRGAGHPLPRYANVGQGSRYPVGGSVGIKKVSSLHMFLAKAKTYLDKCTHRPAYVLRKLGKSDGIVLRPFVTDLNLSPEVAIATPLKVATGSVRKYTTAPKNVTDADAYMRCHLGTKWRGDLCI